MVGRSEGGLCTPVLAKEEILAEPVVEYCFGHHDGRACYCVEIENDVSVSEGVVFRDLRSLLGQMNDDMFSLAGRAYHILNWTKINQYCGRCGAKTSMKHEELARGCQECGNTIFPKISPAVIVAIIKGKEILLAHARHFPENMYSLIAGFVEPGETFEDCIRREVAEEVGIEVKNLRYFGSQPWPFPDSLMVGFTAEYDSGDISVDGNEITSAGWFTKGNLPTIPTSATIAGRIINWFCANY